MNRLSLSGIVIMVFAFLLETGLGILYLLSKNGLPAAPAVVFSVILAGIGVTVGRALVPKYNDPPLWFYLITGVVPAFVIFWGWRRYFDGQRQQDGGHLLPPKGGQ